MTRTPASPPASLSPAPLSLPGRAALLLALLGLVLLPSCGGGGGGSSPPTDTKPFEISLLSSPTTLLAGEPFDVGYRVTGPGAGTSLETLVLWDTTSHPADLTLYPNRSTAKNNLAVPGDFSGSLTSPFAGGPLYLRAYARVEYAGNRSIVLSDEWKIDVQDIAYTADVSSVGLLVSGTRADSMGGFGYQTTDGYLYSLAGATYLADSGTSLTVWFGSDGLPSKAASSTGLVFEFSNWGADTVDVTVHTAADGVVDTETGIFASPTSITKLHALTQENYIGQPGTYAPTSLVLDPSLLLVTGAPRAGRLARGMASGLFLASTVAGRLSPPSSIQGSLDAIAALSTGTLLTKGDQLSGNETIDQINTLLDAYTCFSKDVCLTQDLNQVNTARAADAALRTNVLGP